MPLGSLSARTFTFPQTGGQIPQQEMRSPQGIEGGPPSALQNVEGKTENVYNKFSKIKDWAKTMWSNYGIDVTNPDFSDPLSIKANRLYQKASADLYSEINLLKNSQRMLEDALNRGDQTIAQGYQMGQQPFAESYQQAVVPEGLDPSVKQKLQDYQQVFQQPQLRDQANQELQELQQYWQEVHNQAVEEGNPAQEEYARRQVNAIGSAMYDPTTNIQLGLKRRDLARKERENIPEKTDYWNVFSQLQKGDTTWIEGLRKNGRPVYDDVRFVMQRDKKGNAKPIIKATRIDDKGQLIPTTIDLSKHGGGFFSLYKDYSGEDISWSDVKGLNPTEVQTVGGGQPTGDVDPEYFANQEKFRAAIMNPKGYVDENLKVSEEDYEKASNAIKYRVSTNDLVLPKSIAGIARELTPVDDVKVRKGRLEFTVEGEDEDTEYELDFSKEEDMKKMDDLVELNNLQLGEEVPLGFINQQQEQRSTTSSGSYLQKIKDKVFGKNKNK